MDFSMKKVWVSLFTVCSSLCVLGVCFWKTIVWDLLGIHIEIWIHDFSATSLQDQISLLSWYQLINSLDGTTTVSERTTVLNQYLTNCQNFSLTLAWKISEEETQISYYDNQKELCNNSISENNELFNNAFSVWDFSLAHKYTEKIAESRACIAKNEVFKKEHQYYLKYYSSHSTHIKNKCNYITENKERIIQYYDIMKPELLKELYNISVVLEKNFS